MAILKGVGGLAAAIVLIVAMLVVFYVAVTYIGVLANFGLLIPLAVAAAVVLTLAHMVRRRRSAVTTAPDTSDIPAR